MLSVSNLDELSLPLVSRQEEVNTYLLKKMSSRAKKVLDTDDKIIMAVLLYMYFKSEEKEISKQLALYQAMQERDIATIIEKVAKQEYKGLKSLYEYAKVDYPIYSKNKSIQVIVKRIIQDTIKQYRKFGNSAIFKLKNPKLRNAFVNVSLQEAYNNVVDAAAKTKTTGVDSLSKVMSDLIDSGYRTSFRDSSGRIVTYRMDSAIRTVLYQNLKVLAENMNHEVGKQVGSNGIEISVHELPAPDHAPVQGHQFTMDEWGKLQNGENFEDIKGNKFTGFPREIGTLNCMHYPLSIIVGMKPVYTDSELQAILDRNDKGYTDKDGKHYTLYECSQLQRKYERDIRKAKSGVIVGYIMGDKNLARSYQDRVLRLNNEYRLFSSACKLPTKFNRTALSGYSQKIVDNL